LSCFETIRVVALVFWMSTLQGCFFHESAPAFKENLLRKTGALKTTAARQYYANEEPPVWYVPKSMDHYQCYSTGDRFVPLQIFVDKDDGTLFIFFSQL
jgi:hypothetical protein